MLEPENVRYGFAANKDLVYDHVRVDEYFPDKNEYMITTISEKAETKRVSVVDVVPILSIEEIAEPPADLIKLSQVHPYAILHTLSERFKQDNIYTSIGPILVAINPFKWISGIYDEAVMEDYKKEIMNLEENPHVFAMAHEAYSDLFMGSNQSLIISGESGAGKTEATKQCLNYLAFSAGSSSGLHARILSASPILEAWGNAKTLRNNNSSRFGKFIEIWFDGAQAIVGSSNTTYLLEKSRVVYQESGERNYHIFYQLLKGADNAMLQQFMLKEMAANPTTVNYINQSNCIDMPEINDSEEFKAVQQAFYGLGMSIDNQNSLFGLIAALLHFGNVGFVEDGQDADKATIDKSTNGHLEAGSLLLGINKDALSLSLLCRRIQTGGRRKSVAFSPYNIAAAYDNKNAFVKELYDRCFNWIVREINELTATKSAKAESMIGILDIFGFEIFQKNSFEQFCINLANEALQQHFNYNIFQAEMNAYLAEDVPVPVLEYSDNQDVLDMILKKPRGIIPLLDEEGIVPRGSAEGFVNKIKKQYSDHRRFKAKSAALIFTIVHYAGEVPYDPTLFLVKNKDTLSTDVLEVLEISENNFIAQLFSSEESVEDLEIKDSSPGKMAQKRSSIVDSKMTVGKKFSLQLEQLILKLNSTKPRYIRCIKPNQHKKPNMIVAKDTNEQLTYSGVFEAVIIMQNGYPFRLPHVEFRNMYHMLLSGEFHRQLLYNSAAYDAYCRGIVHDRNFTKNMFKATCASKFDREQCKLMVSLMAADSGTEEFSRCFVGKTKVFYKSSVHLLLRKLRDAKIQSARIFLQRTFRGVIIRRIVRKLQLLEAVSMDAIMSRDITAMNQAIEGIQLWLPRLLKLVNHSVVMNIFGIVERFKNLIQKEEDLLGLIRQKYSEDIDIIPKYDVLEEYFASVRMIELSVTHKGTSLELKWYQNREINAFAELLERMAVAVSVNKKILNGIQETDEISLEQTLLELIELRATGDVEEQFCIVEEKQAREIVHQAEKLYEEFLTAFVNAASQGQIKKLRLSGMTNLEIEVNSKPLANFVATYSEPDQQTKRFLLSKKVLLLLDTAISLADLRKLCEMQRWKQMWECIQTTWKNFLVISESKVGDSNGLFVPDTINDLLVAEIEDASIIALQYCVVPWLEDSLKKNGVPEIPQYSRTETVYVDTSDLEEAYSAAEQYMEHFDDYLKDYMEIVKEHLQVRKAISSADPKIIRSTFNSIKRIPSDHPDVVNIGKYIALYQIIADLCQAVTHDRLRGEPGFLQFDLFDNSRLRKTIERAEELHAIGNDWLAFLSYCKQVLTIRTTLRTGHPDLILEMLNSAEYLGMYNLSQSIEEVESKPSRRQSVSVMKVDEALFSIKEELSCYLAEVKHLLALRGLEAAINIGAVSGDVGRINLQQIQSDTLSLVLEQSTEDLIPTEEVVALLKDCEILLDVRDAVVAQHWSEVYEMINKHYNDTYCFEKCHPACKEEFLCIYDEMHNVRIYENTIDCIRSGHIINTSDGFAMPEGSLKKSLNVILEKQNSNHKISDRTAKAGNLLEFMYSLRSSVAKNHWETGSNIPFANVPSSKILESIFALSWIKRGVISQGHDFVLAVLSLENADLSDEVNRKIREHIFTDLSVANLLHHAAFIDDEDCAEEIYSIKKEAYDRRCKAVLLVSSLVGQIKGTVDEIHFEDIDADILHKSCNYVQTYLELCSSLTAKWYELSLLLLALRQVFLKLQLNPDDDGNLFSLFEEIDMDRVSNVLNDSSSAEFQHDFPLDEFRLVHEKHTDTGNVFSILQALANSGPTFSNGKFDASRVQYEHIVHRQQAAKKYPVRSDKLDRLFFYAELCINLRVALSSNQWYLSEKGEKANVDRAIVTVKSCLDEFKQAEKFFNSPVAGVPPKILVDEFQLVGREWERRLILQRFRNAFRYGAITGPPLALSLREIRTDALQKAIDTVKLLIEESGEVDLESQGFVDAAVELIAIRAEAKRIQSSYRPVTTFYSHHDDSIGSILEDPGFLTDAVERAIDNVSRLQMQPFRIAEEWKTMATLIGNLKACEAIPFDKSEIVLLQMESSIRNFVVSTLSSIKILKKVWHEGEMAIFPVISDMKETLKEFERVKVKHSLHNDLLEYMYASGLLALYLGIAKMEDLYEDLHRNWREDPSFLRTPRVHTLARHNSTDENESSTMVNSRSVQAILRSAFKLPLHPIVCDLLDLETRIVDDKVTASELYHCLKNPSLCVSGSVGNLSVHPDSIAILKKSIERANSIGIHDEELQKVLNFAKNMLIARECIATGQSIAAVNALCSSLQISNSLEKLLDVVNAKAYQIPDCYDKREFSLLLDYWIDQSWLDSVTSELHRGVIKGKRGALLITHSIVSSSELDELLFLSNRCPSLSNNSRSMKDLVSKVHSLRLMILETDKMESPSDATIAALDYHGVGLTERLHHFVEAVSAVAVGNAINAISAITKINTKTVGVEFMNIEIRSAIKQIAASLSLKRNYFSESLRSDLSNEIRIIGDHIDFIESRKKLEKVLVFNPITLSTNGLEFSREKVKQFQDAIARCKGYGWKNGFTEEWWWFYLLMLLEIIVDLLNTVGSRGRSFDVLIPGTEQFTLALPLLHSFLENYNTFKDSLALRGYRKGAIPRLLQQSNEYIHLALTEHFHLYNLDKLIAAENVLNFTNDKNIYDICVHRIKNIFLIENDMDCAESYITFAPKLLEHINGLKITSNFGNLLLNSVTRLIEFRIAVAKRNWYEAQNLSSFIHWVNEFPTRSQDVDTFKNFVRVMSSMRILEQGVFSCSYPVRFGWSLSKNAFKVAGAVSDRRLKRIVEDLKWKSQDLIDSISSISQLVSISEKVIELVSSVQAGVWISAYNLESYDENKDEFNKVIRISGTNKQELLFLNDESHSTLMAQDFSLSKSVLDVVFELKDLVAETTSIETHFANYLNRNIISNFTTESLALQLEFLCQKVFKESAMIGRPGELVFDKHSIPMTKHLIAELMAMEHVKISHDVLQIRSALQGSKILSLLYKSHFVGDLASMGNYIDLLLYLNTLPDNNMEIPMECMNMAPIFDVDELLKMDDDAYVDQCCRIVKNDYQPRKSSTGISIQKSAGSDFNMSIISKTFKIIFGTGISEAMKLRREIADSFLPLAINHFTFESQYNSYVKCIRDTSATGNPGELVLSRIRVDTLSEITEVLRECEWCNEGVAFLLRESAESLLLIREGQLKEAEDLIASGVGRAKIVIKLEKEAKSDSELNKTESSVSLFGGIQKRFALLAVREVELAEQDLQQRSVIRRLLFALDTPGVCSLEYPQDLTHLDFRSLENALDACQKTRPTCTKAVYLMRSAEILVKLRYLAYSGLWDELNEYFGDLDEGVVDYFNEKIQQEFHMTRDLMTLHLALNLAMEAYSTGNICGEEGKIDIGEIDAELPCTAVNAFSLVRKDMITDVVSIHICSCQWLERVRKQTLALDWRGVYKIATEAVGDQVTSLCSEASKEITLARDNAAYMLCTQSLLNAVSNNKIGGVIGKLDLTNVLLIPLQEAYKIPQDLTYTHEDVKRLKKSADLLFKLRKAVLFRHWDDNPGAESMQEILGPNFSHFTSQDLGSNTVPLTQTIDLVRDTRSHNSVESVIKNYHRVKELDWISSEIDEEFDFALKELNYRQLTMKLANQLLSPGFQGEPGNVDSSCLSLRQLETAIKEAMKKPEVSSKERCRSLLYDAIILLKIRKLRNANDWIAIEQLTADVEKLQNSILNGIDRSSALTETLIPDNNVNKKMPPSPIPPPPPPGKKGNGTEAKRTVQDKTALAMEQMLSDLTSMNFKGRPAIAQSVWNEISLLRADAQFFICLADFAREMMGDSEEIANKKYVVDAAKIVRMNEIVDRTLRAASLIHSDEFERLLEAEYAALELRKFYHNEPNKSPQEIITKLAKTKRRDKDLDRACYMTLLIYEIDKMSEVLDFPLNMEIIQKEIINGQKYLQYPVGCIDYSEIDVEVMQAAYQASMPSLEIMGSDDHHAFMKTAGAVIAMRKTLSTGDLRAVMRIIVENERYLQSPVIAEEIQRMRVEMENAETTKLIEIALKNGRYLNVVSIAKLVSKYDRRVSENGDTLSAWKPIDAYDKEDDELAEDESKAATNEAGQCSLETIKNYYQHIYHDVEETSSAFSTVTRNRLSLRRDNSHISSSLQDRIDACHKIFTDQEVFQHEKRRSSSARYKQRNKRNTLRMTSRDESVRNYSIQLLTSINALKRAVNVANTIKLKADTLSYHINAANHIINLRELIIDEKWADVRDLVKRDLDLPEIAKEEISAINEGLMFRQCMTLLTKSFMQGSITGQPHSIFVADVNYTNLDFAIAKCSDIEFSDSSAKIIIDFAKKLKLIRKSFLDARWHSEEMNLLYNLDEFNSEESPYEIQSETMGSPNPRKSKIKVAPMVLPPSYDPEKITVDEAVDDFFQFHQRNFEYLVTLLKEAISERSSLGREDGGSRIRFQSYDSQFGDDTPLEAPNSLSFQESDFDQRENTKGDGSSDWLIALWEAVNAAVGEANLVSEVIRYREIVDTVISATEQVPDAVKVFMGDSTGIQLYFQKASAMFNANEGNNDDVVMLNSLEISESWQELDDSTFVHDTNTEDHYHLSTIHQAIYFTEEYLSTVAERGEDIKKLLATMKLLFSFRRALHGKADLDGEKMVELVEEAKTRIANKEISGDHGLYEIKAYIKATEKAIVIKQGLIATLHNNQVCGYLNELYLDGVDYVDLERWITKARNFLITGRDMTIGLSTLVDQAKVLFKLRKGVKNNNWLQIDKILSSGLQKLSEWRYIKTELLHIEKAFQYRSFYVNMNQILSEFTILTTKEQSSTPVTLGGKQEYKTINSKNDLEYNFYSYKVDLQQFNDLFAIFDGIAQYSSDLLPPNAQCSLSNRFFTETKFSACKATWRLLRAVVNQNWYQKKSIYSEPSQKIDINVDLLIYDFFGLDDADYVDNGYLWEQHVIKNNKNNNLVIQEAFAPLNHNETVFSVLISTNWSFFSQNLWNFYRRARNSLIDIYVRTDLKYYCLHGGTSIDKAGNIVVSDMYLQCLLLALADVTKAEELSRKHNTTLAWSQETLKWIECGELLRKCRESLMQGNIEELLEIMTAHGYLKGPSSVLNLRYVDVSQELEDIEKYCYSYLAEKTVRNCLQYINSLSGSFGVGSPRSLSVDSKKISYISDILKTSKLELLVNNSAVSALNDLVMDAVIMREPTAYHSSILNISRLLKRCINCTPSGNYKGLQSTIGSIERYFSNHAAPLSRSKYEFFRAFTVLVKACEIKVNSKSMVDKISAIDNRYQTLLQLKDRGELLLSPQQTYSAKLSANQLAKRNIDFWRNSNDPEDDVYQNQLTAKSTLSKFDFKEDDVVDNWKYISRFPPFYLGATENNVKKSPIGSSKDSLNDKFFGGDSSDDNKATFGHSFNLDDVIPRDVIQRLGKNIQHCAETTKRIVSLLQEFVSQDITTIPAKFLGSHEDLEDVMLLRYDYYVELQNLLNGELQEDFYVMEPMWTIAVGIVLYYLSRESLITLEVTFDPKAAVSHAGELQPSSDSLSSIDSGDLRYSTDRTDTKSNLFSALITKPDQETKILESSGKLVKFLDESLHGVDRGLLLGSEDDCYQSTDKKSELHDEAIFDSDIYNVQKDPKKSSSARILQYITWSDDAFNFITRTLKISENKKKRQNNGDQSDSTKATKSNSLFARGNLTSLEYPTICTHLSKLVIERKRFYSDEPTGVRVHAKDAKKPLKHLSVQVSSPASKPKVVVTDLSEMDSLEILSVDLVDDSWGLFKICDLLELCESSACCCNELYYPLDVPARTSSQCKSLVRLLQPKD